VPSNLTGCEASNPAENEWCAVSRPLFAIKAVQAQAVAIAVLSRLNARLLHCRGLDTSAAVRPTPRASDRAIVHRLLEVLVARQFNETTGAAKRRLMGNRLSDRVV
jgi:hypothetical protein